MLIIGLTGGVASGKNFVASQLQKLKIPVFDADLEVHQLLAKDQNIIFLIKRNFPPAVIDGKVDRKILADQVLNDQKKLQILEQIIYPQLHKRENDFIKNCRRNHRKIIVLNIPLLFEKGGYKRCDKTIAVITSKLIQFHRFKNRFKQKNNSELAVIEDKFKKITKHQINNLQRKNQADYLVYNGLNKGFTTRQVKNLLFAKIAVNTTSSIKNYCFSNNKSAF